MVVEDTYRYFARANLSTIVNRRAGISPEMAIKLAESFGNTPRFWLNLQKNYELWYAEQNVNRSKIRHFWKKMYSLPNLTPNYHSNFTNPTP